MTYGWETTTDELLEGKDLWGQRILITGGSAGLGAETARALAAHGANLRDRRARARQGRAGGGTDTRRRATERKRRAH